MNTISVSDLLHLSVDERIRLMEDLWDSVADEVALHPDALRVSEAQRLELLRRSDAHRLSPGATMDLDESLNEIERLLG
jgi:putative addiction module component (TIGR02574 family)